MDAALDERIVNPELSLRDLGRKHGISCTTLHRYWQRVVSLARKI
jgi:hypothetical protein